MEGNSSGAATEQPKSWASLFAAYREGPPDRWSGLLLERLGPWLTVAKRQLRAVPPYLDLDDVAQQLALEVLRIATRWRPGCEDRWIPRRLVERAARRVGEGLLRERLAATEELDPDLESGLNDEPRLLFDTPVGKATPEDLRVIYRARVLDEPIELLAREAGVTPVEMRRRIRAARTRARATAQSRSRA